MDHVVPVAYMDGNLLADRVETARSFRQRAVGLLGRNGLPEGTVMWIHHAPSIHTIGMRFAIDVIFLNRHREIVKVVWTVPSFRLVFGGLGADSVLEAQTGWLNRNSLNVGHRISMVSPPASGIANGVA